MIGIDEVGRGCWAGPLLVVAAKLTGVTPEGLRDSKLLSKRKRLNLYSLLTKNFVFGEGWVEPGEIDELGLSDAMRLGVSRALAMIDANSEDSIILDGNINYCASQFTDVTAVIGADDIHPVVSAASIYAKITRDNYMKELSKKYPIYGFDKHVGYGTQKHREALKEYGVSEAHRLSFKPVARMI